MKFTIKYYNRKYDCVVKRSKYFNKKTNLKVTCKKTSRTLKLTIETKRLTFVKNCIQSIRDEEFEEIQDRLEKSKEDRKTIFWFQIKRYSIKYTGVYNANNNYSKNRYVGLDQLEYVDYENI